MARLAHVMALNFSTMQLFLIQMRWKLRSLHGLQIIVDQAHWRATEVLCETTRSIRSVQPA